MSQSQERNDDTAPTGRAPADQAPGRRSGEGAASAMEHLISQDRQRQPDGRDEADVRR
ncbi:hypothetical protein [Ramlibacter henchirensis]|uniref:hypothetical protein n=1 Tax=Ramlibacter henchirensis TaxID=204072 RepID=UPI00142F658F|nr:hypothetical protein [Ramlibacter henchirensis]